MNLKKIHEIPQELKQKVFEAYGIDISKSNLYQIDYLITPEVGGGNDIKNLWPQSLTSKPWNAHMKDRLENHLHREICQGRMSPNHAQTLLTLDWIDSYCIIFEDMTTECLDYRKKENKITRPLIISKDNTSFTLLLKMIKRKNRPKSEIKISDE